MDDYKLIGRKSEIDTLEKAYASGRSEFVAIYGRLHVGKTCLVNQVFRGRIAFSVTGTRLRDKDDRYYRNTQLRHFHKALCQAGLDSEAIPRSWREAFLLLKKLLRKKRTRRKVIFIDELPWLAGPQPNEFISELGYFWNSWADAQRNIVLVTCGSATSWMLDNVISDYGGLHGRLTRKIKLRPFTLGESEAFFREKGFHLSRYEISSAYMAIGGIPYYMDMMDSELTITENIDRMFFANESIHQEFKDVYTGLYSSKERYIDIVVALGKHFYGMTQKEIVQATGLNSGGTLSKMLENLVESGMIRTYPRYGGKRVENVYQLVDFFSLFYLRFCHGKPGMAGRWNSIQRSATFYTWAGDTFELLCFEHLDQMQKALVLPTIDSCFTWSGKGPSGNGVQIDMVIQSKASRTDFICEMKFSSSKFPVTSKVEEDILEKAEVFASSKMHLKSHSIQIVLVTTMGLAGGTHTGVANRSLTLQDLFR